MARLTTGVLAGDEFGGTRTGLGSADVAGGAWKNNSTMGVDGSGHAVKVSGTGTARAFSTLPYAGSRILADGVTSTGGTGKTLTSTTGAFTSADIGRPVVGTNIPASTTIASINSSTSVEMSANATGSGSALTVVIGQVTLDFIWKTNVTTNLSDAGVSLWALDSWATRGGQLYVSLRKTSGGNSVRILHRANTGGADTALFTNSSAAWADNTTYWMKVVTVGKTVDVLRATTDPALGGTYTSVISGPQTISDAVLNTLGTDVGISFTNTDTGSYFDDFFAIDPYYVAPTPTPTTTRLIVHRTLPTGQNVKLEESAPGRALCPAGINGGEFDVRKPSDSSSVFYNMHDTTSSRTSTTTPTSDFTAPGTVAQYVAANIPTTQSCLDACIAAGDTDIHFQVEADTQPDISAIIGWLIATYSAVDQARIIVMTSATAGATPRADRIRTAGWTGRIGCYGMDSTAYSTYSSQLATAGVFLLYVPLGDTSYLTTNHAQVAIYKAAGYQVGASTITPAAFAQTQTDALEYVLTDYPVEFLALYDPPQAPLFYGTAATSGSGSLSTSGTPRLAATAAVSGSGSLTSTATPAAVGTAAFTGSGALAASGVPRPIGAATTSGSGTLTTGGTPAIPGTAAVSGTGTLAASGSASSPGSGTADTSGTGTLTASGQPKAIGVATLTGSGSLSTTFLPRVAGAAAFTGTGVLVASGFAGGGGGPTPVTPDERTLTIDAEDRTLYVPADPRSAT